MREELEEMKREVQEIHQESLAMSLLKDYKAQNKRQFIVILVILAMWFATIGYLVYILNDIGVVEETTYEQEITDIESIGGSITNSGDIYGDN